MVLRRYWQGRPYALSDTVRVTRRTASFLLAAGLFQYLVWPTFLRNIWADPRSFHHGPTAFLVVHAVLTAVQLALATALVVLGGRGLRRGAVR